MSKLDPIATQHTWRFHAPSSSGLWMGAFEAKPKGKKTADKSKLKADAIYNYLRAVRTLGKQRITSSDVAGALNLPEAEVRRIMLSMEDRGVRAR